ncbi:MAG: GtrA family protein [Lachnospira sp.]
MKLLSKDGIKQFISYFFVGGMAAIVEWVMFFILGTLIGINYMAATVIAFIFSTTANWFLGRVMTFKDNKNYENKKGKELFLVFAVSGIGLVFNLILMYLFVTILGFDEGLQKTFCKIVSTGIVFIWNFLIRKLVIYK